MLEEVKQENGTWSLVAQFVTRSIDQSDGTVPTDNINIAAVVQFDERPGSRIGLVFQPARFRLCLFLLAKGMTGALHPGRDDDVCTFQSDNITAAQAGFTFESVTKLAGITRSALTLAWLTSCQPFSLGPRGDRIHP